MDAEEVDWITAVFIMMIVQADRVVAMNEDMEAGVEDEAAEVVLEQRLESC